MSFTLKCPLTEKCEVFFLQNLMKLATQKGRALFV